MPVTRKPSLRFYHSVPLRTRTHTLLTAIERDDDPTLHTAALADLVVELTEAGMNYYFVKPLEAAKLGFVARQTAHLGMSGAVRVMAPMIRSILSGTDGTQLRVFARHIRHLMA